MPNSPMLTPDPSDSSAQAAEKVETPVSLVLKLDSTREFLPNPHPTMVAGGWLALLTIVTSLYGCWVTPYNVKVKAPAQVHSSQTPPKVKNSLITSNQAFSIQAWVPNNSINSIEIGQKVQIRLNSCPYPTYGTFKGKVTYISETTKAVENSAKSLMNFAAESPKTFNSYKTAIHPEASTLEAAGKKSCELRAGMEGRADILVGQERLLNFLMQKVRL